MRGRKAPAVKKPFFAQTPVLVMLGLFGALALGTGVYLYADMMQEGTVSVKDSDWLVGGWMEAATAAKERGEFEEALKLLDEILKQTPGDARALSNRAEINLLLKRLDAALADLNAAVAILEKSTEYDRAVAGLVFLNRGIIYNTRMDSGRAVPDFNRSLEELKHSGADNNRQLSAVLAHRGVAYEQLRQLDEALKDFTEAMRLDEKNSMAFHGHGNIMLVSGDHETAINDYTRTVTLDPSNVNALTNRAYAYLDRGDTREALVDFTTLLQRFPDNPELNSIVGKLQSALELAEREAALEDAAMITPPPTADGTDEAPTVKTTHEGVERVDNNNDDDDSENADDDDDDDDGGDDN